MGSALTLKSMVPAKQYSQNEGSFQLVILCKTRMWEYPPIADSRSGDVQLHRQEAVNPQE